MVDVTDTGRANRKLERQWALLDDANIDDRDREQISEFVTHRGEIEEKAAGTLINDLKALRLGSERARCPLVEMDMADVRALFDELTTPKEDGGYGLTPDAGGIYNYRRGLRVFFKFLDAERDDDRYDFWERIDVPQANLGTSYDREQLLSEEEVTALKNHTRNRRDRVLIDFLADVPARISLATSLRCGDIGDLESEDPTFTPNEEALNLKRVPIREYPIMYSVGELQTWLAIDHPEAPDPHDEAPLFPVVQGYDPDDRATMAASNSTIRDRLKEAADRAGIDKPVRPHAFRHVTLTRIANSDLTDRQIEHLAMLADMDMIKEVYDHTSDTQRNRKILARLGLLDDPELEDEESVTMVNCSHCRTPVKSKADECPRCGFDPHGQTVSAARAVRVLTEFIAESDETVDRKAGAEMMEALVNGHDDPS